MIDGTDHWWNIAWQEIAEQVGETAAPVLLLPS